jgi:hypothetical protein
MTRCRVGASDHRRGIGTALGAQVLPPSLPALRLACPCPAWVPASDTGNDTHTIEGETRRHETSRHETPDPFDVLSSLLSIIKDNRSIESIESNQSKSK